MSTNQSSCPDSGQTLHHQYGISVIETQTSLPRNVPSGEEQADMAVFVDHHPFPYLFVFHHNALRGTASPQS